MIAYVFLSAGIAGAGAFVYFVAPAGRGLHRYAVPRSKLRADLRHREQEADQLACTVIQLTTANTDLAKERDEFSEALVAARERILDLEEELDAYEELRQENTRLHAELANATAIRPLRPVLADDTVSALPDDRQEFTDTTATAWRSGA